MAQISSRKCDICETETGKLYCYECRHFLCDPCKRYHDKFQKKHTTTDLHNVDRLTLSQQLTCEQHKEDFVHFCSSCECLTCSLCATSAHQSHSLTQISEVVSQARENVRYLIDQLKKKTKTLTEFIKPIKTTKLQKLKSENEQYSSEVDTTSEQIIFIVKAVRDINMTRASDFLVLEKQQLEFTIAKLEKMYNEHTSLSSQLEQVLQTKHDVAFFLNQKSITNQIKDLDNIPSTIEEPDEIEKFKTVEFVKAVVKEIESQYNIGQRDAHRETRMKPKFLLHGSTICDTAWRVVHGIKYRRYQYIRRKLQSTGSTRILNLNDSRKGMQYQTTAYIHAKDFLQNYVKHFGDDQPDTKEVHLPSCVTKKCVYTDYELNCLTKGLQSIKLSRFYQIWEAEFGYVKVRKHQKMTQCAECAVFKEAFLKKLTPEEAIELEIKRKAHLTLQRICREDYYKHRSKAAAEPKKYVSVIVDNMDQSKTNLPRFPFVSKSDSSLSKLHHHVTGVLCHSLKRSYAFTWTDQFAGNCNITLNCLMSVLDDVAKENGGSLPPTLYIQADNAAKDNKNNYVLLFLAMLVKAKLARKIKFSFLMVGHTHEDVDQFFSRISTKANQQPAVTLTDLHNLVEDCTNPSPIVKSLNSIWDFRSVADLAPVKLQNFKECHVFKFKFIDNRVHLYYKNWPLKTEDYRCEDITDVTPDFIQPSVCSYNATKFEPLLSKMEADLPKWVETGRFNNSSLVWWTQYIQQLRQRPAEPTIPLPQSFLPWSMPRPMQPVLEENVLRVINRHVNKIRQKSVITVKRKRT